MPALVSSVVSAVLAVDTASNERLGSYFMLQTLAFDAEVLLGQADKSKDLACVNKTTNLWHALNYWLGRILQKIGKK